MNKKMIKAIEKISYAVRILFWDIGKKERLSPAQIQFLTYLNTHSEKFCRIGQLAKEFGLTQATVSGSIKSLEKKALVSKRASKNDRRISVLKLTPQGRRLANRLSRWPGAISSYVKKMPDDIKQTVTAFLMGLIESLQKAGVITVARMCVTCSNFQRNIRPRSSLPHYCVLTGRPIGRAELSIDCERYEQRPKDGVQRMRTPG